MCLMHFNFLGPSRDGWWKVCGLKQLSLHIHGKFTFTDILNENIKREHWYSQMKTLTVALSSSFQRWKEQYFVNVGTDCGLTIAGFYYVCFSCNDGSISGFYYDPNSRCFLFQF
jgi:hypothetical protein